MERTVKAIADIINRRLLQAFAQARTLDREEAKQLCLNVTADVIDRCIAVTKETFEEQRKEEQRKKEKE
jgi:hypothetical protein